MIHGLLFDFDGTIADSETLAQTVLAEAVTALGVPTTVEDSFRLYMGKRWTEAVVAIEHAVGRELPVAFATDLKETTLARFRTSLSEVNGAGRFIRRYAALPHAIASSSSADRLALCLEVLKLGDMFVDAVFSADSVTRGKPAPDIYLYAADRLGLSPGDCLVIEDSIGGVEAGVAAGMTVLGLSAASHVRPGHADRLRAAGATLFAASWAEAEGIVAGLVAPGLTPARPAARAGAA